MGGYFKELIFGLKPTIVIGLHEMNNGMGDSSIQREGYLWKHHPEISISEKDTAGKTCYSVVRKNMEACDFLSLCTLVRCLQLFNIVN